MIFFECLKVKGTINEDGFVRWGDIGFFMNRIQSRAGRILTNAIANALLNSSEIDKIILNWFDLAFDDETHSH